MIPDLHQVIQNDQAQGEDVIKQVIWNYILYIFLNFSFMLISFE